MDLINIDLKYQQNNLFQKFQLINSVLNQPNNLKLKGLNYLFKPLSLKTKIKRVFFFKKLNFEYK